MTDKNFDLEKWRKEVFTRMREGLPPKVIVGRSELGEKHLAKFDNRNPPTDIDSKITEKSD